MQDILQRADTGYITKGRYRIYYKGQIQDILQRADTGYITKGRYR
jgi:hypothetical protein